MEWNDVAVGLNAALLKRFDEPRQEPSPSGARRGQDGGASPTVGIMVGEVVHLRGGPPRRRVVVTFALSPEASVRLSEVLGAGFELVDIKVSEGDEELVLVQSSSRQLTGKLRDAFPTAALLVVEVEDVAYGVNLGGQVLRTLDAGADGYFVARSVEELASIVDRASDRIDSADLQEPAALTEAAADELGDFLDALILAREHDGAAARRESPGE